MRSALITGITGQDGSYLAEFLIEKGYQVHGIMRRSSSFNTGRIEHLYLDEWVRDMRHPRKVELHWGDMTDSSSLIGIINDIRPDEIYNLAAQSHVKVSFDVPEFTADTDALGVLRLLEAVRICGIEDCCRIYQASTSELYGKVKEVPQSEDTPFCPRSPYAVAKLYGYWMVKNYRESYGMYCCNGILFNHESERRGETFVTRKITLAAARIAQGLQDKLYLGNLNALRDWGYAKDYVECMWLMLQQDKPEDFVIATGEYHSVREFCTIAFRYVGIDIEWRGEGEEEKGYIKDIRPYDEALINPDSTTSSENKSVLNSDKTISNNDKAVLGGRKSVSNHNSRTKLGKKRDIWDNDEVALDGEETALDENKNINPNLHIGDVIVEVDPKYFRPAEVDQLLGDPSKARRYLGWNPRKTSFEDLIKIMIEHDMKRVKNNHKSEYDL